MIGPHEDTVVMICLDCRHRMEFPAQRLGEARCLKCKSKRLKTEWFRDLEADEVTMICRNPECVAAVYAGATGARFSIRADMIAQARCPSCGNTDVQKETRGHG